MMCVVKGGNGYGERRVCERIQRGEGVNADTEREGCAHGYEELRSLIHINVLNI